jgi:hypothetical protein
VPPSPFLTRPLLEGNCMHNVKTHTNARTGMVLLTARRRDTGRSAFQQSGEHAGQQHGGVFTAASPGAGTAGQRGRQHGGCVRGLGQGRWVRGGQPHREAGEAVRTGRLTAHWRVGKRGGRPFAQHSLPASRVVCSNCCSIKHFAWRGAHTVEYSVYPRLRTGGHLGGSHKISWIIWEGDAGSRGCRFACLWPGGIGVLCRGGICM